jgi:hypothetical protein
MRTIHRIILSLLIVILLPYLVSAYEKHDPIFIEGMYATADEPYIIEGYEISSSEKNCLEIKDSEHVIIRDNYFHNCTYHSDSYPGGWQEGHSVYVEKSKNIVIENNWFEDNTMGPYVRHTTNVGISDNTVKRSVYHSAIRCDYCKDFDISGNILKDNGIPEWFFNPGIRLIGIWAMSSDNGEIFNNTVMRSTSDGISICGNDYVDNNWTVLSKNIKVYNNLIIDNLEQGIWAQRVRDLQIFNNTIRTTCYQQRNGIFFEFDVDDSEVFSNRIAVCRGMGFGLWASHDNRIYDNKHYSIFEEPFYIHSSFEADCPQKAKSAGIPYKPASGNEIFNNTLYLLEGELAGAMKEKYNISEEKKTYDSKGKGMEGCEDEYGVVDEECIKDLEGKSDIGVDSNLLGYSPQMTDFDRYVSREYVFDENLQDYNASADDEWDAECSENDIKCEGKSFFVCQDSLWHEKGKIAGRCGFDEKNKKEHKETGVEDSSDEKGSKDIPLILFFIVFVILLIFLILYIRKKKFS